MSQTQTLVLRKQLPSKATNTILKMDLQPRWYFGGLASAGACCFTHPLDLLKVLLQTEGKTKGNLWATARHVSKEQGVLALWSGISASILRQLTYSTTRFAIYDLVKLYVSSQGNYELGIWEKIGLACFAGAVGGFVGSPADMMNVRMQNDVKLPLEERGNYKNAFHGLYRVTRNEGFIRLFNGATMASGRGAIVSAGQLAGYDIYKGLIVNYFSHLNFFSNDSVITHFTASFLSGVTATAITQPLDVMKTRLMANKGEKKSIFKCASEIMREKPIFGFWKGFMPAFIRLGPHTILMFLFKEQLTMYFGYEKELE